MKRYKRKERELKSSSKMRDEYTEQRKEEGRTYEE